MRNLIRKTNYFIIVLTLFIFLGNINKSFSQSTDWLQWRGQNADGYSSEKDWNPEVALKKDAILWETNVGMGFSAPAIKGDRLYISGNFEKEDSTFYDKIVCLNTSTGKEIWNYEYLCKELQDPGPFSSPVLNDGYLYTLSREGHFLCLNAENGDVVWKHNLVKENLVYSKEDKILIASSPLVYKDLVILNSNKSGIAFNKKNGKLIWNSEKVEDNYNISTPILFENNNKTMLAVQTKNNTSAVNPLTGEVYWQIGGGAMPDPIIVKDKMYHFTTEEGFRKYLIKKDSVELIWSKSEIKCQCQPFVVKDNYAYGIGRGEIQCISLETGEQQWGKSLKGGALIISNNILIINDQNGNLVFVEATPKEYKEIANLKTTEYPKTDQKGRGYRRVSGCWTNPVLSHGQIYIRGSYGDLVCINVSKKKL